MQIQVNGKQIDVGEALTEHVRSQLSATIEKYFDRPVDATVTFSREGRALRCDAHVHLPTGIVAQSTGTAQDIYAAFDQGAGRIEKQLRRYKRRLRDHHRQRKEPVATAAAPAFVLAAANFEQETDEPETLNPTIVAETTHDIKSLNVGEAVMQMELAGQTYLLFRNDANGRINLVHSRDDGNIGWIDPASEQTTS